MNMQPGTQFRTLHRGRNLIKEESRLNDAGEPVERCYSLLLGKNTEILFQDDGSVELHFTFFSLPFERKIRLRRGRSS